MISRISSSLQTIGDPAPGKLSLEEGNEESLINLNGLEIPDMNLCNSFDFMNEDDVLPDLD